MELKVKLINACHGQTLTELPQEPSGMTLVPASHAHPTYQPVLPPAQHVTNDLASAH